MKLKFCSVCDNLLYISISSAPADDGGTGGTGGSGSGGSGSGGIGSGSGGTGDVEMRYVCKNCGDTQRATNDGDGNGNRDGLAESICVLETRLGEDESSDWKRYMTPYLKYDPTLPRVSHIICPNPRCKSASSSPEDRNEVIVVKYDKPNMKYLYSCEGCNTFWRTGEMQAGAV